MARRAAPLAAGAAVCLGTVLAQAAPAAAGPMRWTVLTLPVDPASAAMSSYAEPGIAIARDGTVVVDAATANTGALPTMWVSHDGGTSWTPGRDVDTTGTSTGDADVATGADGYVYALNLGYNPNPPGRPVNPTVFVDRSPDGRTWLGPASFPSPHGADQPDRPWLAVDPRNPAHVDVVNSEGGGDVVLWRSTDHGATFGGPTPVTGGANGQAALALSSRPLFDPTDAQRLFMLYESVSPAGAVATVGTGPPVDEFPMTQVWLAASVDGGRSWTNRPVLDTTSLAPPLRGGTVAHLLVASAVDSDGTLYAAFSLRPHAATSTLICLIDSRDHGRTWSRPLVVTAPTSSNVMPALAVGPPGVAYLSWYGSRDADYRDRAATWAEMVAVVADALSPRPAVTAEQVSGPQPVHVGGVDTAGTIGSDLGDDWGLRDLQSIAMDGCGRPHPVWAVDAGRRVTRTAVPVTACAAAGVAGTATAPAAPPATAHAALPATAHGDQPAQAPATGIVLAVVVTCARRRARFRARAHDVRRRPGASSRHGSHPPRHRR